MALALFCEEKKRAMWGRFVGLIDGLMGTGNISVNVLVFGDKAPTGDCRRPALLSALT